jgi:hypothetical protein
MLMSTTKLALWAVIAVLVALLVGWVWGASGRWSVQAQLRDTQLRLHLATGRAGLLAARVDVFELNFGQASRDLEAARRALADANRISGSTAPAQVSADIQQAMQKAEEAQQLAGNVDQAANSRAAEAVRLLDRAAGTAQK